MSLDDIALHSDDGPVGSGGSQARYITATDGTKWIAKATYFGGQTHRYLYLNEALAGLVALRLGVNVPRMAVLRLSTEQAEAFQPGRSDADRVIFASERIEPHEALTPEAAAAADPAELASIIVLDALVWNTDEKAEHVLAQIHDGVWKLWPVDHGHTLAVADALQSLPDQNAPFARIPLLADPVPRDHLVPWIDQAQSITQEEFLELVRSLPPEWIVEADGAERLGEALRNRALALESVLFPHFLKPTTLRV